MTAAWVVAAGLAAAAPAMRPAQPPTVFNPRDFVEYWSAARVHARGGDPYDARQLLPHQREATGDLRRTEATMLWNPPWTLPLYTPFALLDPRPAHLAWLGTQLACVFLSAWLLWRTYGGPTGGLWPLAPLGMAAAFAPVGWMVWYGQNTGFLVLGLAGFLHLRQRGYPVAAGAVAALTAIKPHLLMLFGVALLLDAATRPGRRALAGGVAVLLLASAAAVLPDPDVFGQLARAITRPRTAESAPVTEWRLPLAAYQLRLAVDGDRNEAFWVQFVPCLAACALVVVYWWRRRDRWSWPTELPRLVFASVLTAGYGGWMFDLTVLLVPVIQATVWLTRHPRPVPPTALAAVLVLLSMLTIFPRDVYERWVGEPPWLHHFIWFAPAVLGWYLAVAAVCPRPDRQGGPSPASPP